MFFLINFSSPTIWNKFFTENEKPYTSIAGFGIELNNKNQYFFNHFLSFYICVITSNFFMKQRKKRSLLLL